MNSMNQAQTIFTLFYGLYFAATIPLTRPLRPFDTPAMWGCDPHAWRRFIVSFFLLNLLPLAYFVFIFGRLSELNDFKMSFCSMFLLLLVSVAGFGFYRIYFGVMLLPFRGKYLFYGTELPQGLCDELKQRSSRHGEVVPHLMPGIIWVAISMAAGCLLIRHY